MERLAVLTFAVAVATTALAHGPTRQKVVEEITINAPIEEVWKEAGDFCSIAQWHPGVERCEREGKRRLLVLKGGYKIVDELKKFQPERFMYKYKTKRMDAVSTLKWHGEEVQVPVIPVANFSAVFQLKEVSDGATKAVWKGAFYRAYLKNDPPESMAEEAARTAVRKFFQEGLEGLKALVEGERRSRAFGRRDQGAGPSWDHGSQRPF